MADHTEDAQADPWFRTTSPEQAGGGIRAWNTMDSQCECLSTFRRERVRQT
jgi:hypothetical protein